MVEGRKNIALCLSGINDEIQSRIIHFISIYAQQFGYNTAVFTCLGRYFSGSPHEKGEVNIFNLVNLDLFSAVIILPETIINENIYMSIIKNAKKKNIPVITINCPIDGCYNILIPHDICIENILEHFIHKHGFKYINFINGTPSWPVGKARLNIYKNTLKRNGIPFDENRVENGYFWSGPIPEIIDKFLAQVPRPQAIICANDVMAVAAIERLNERGISVPEDICVSGYDGLEMAVNFNPSLTTGTVDIEKLSKKAVEILNKALNNEACEMNYMMPVSINYAQSCGCNDISFSLPKITKVGLYDKISANNYFHIEMIRMNEMMTSSSSIDEAAEKIAVNMIHCVNENSWFLITDSFINDSNRIYEAFIKDDYIKEGYGQQLSVFLRIKNGKKISCKTPYIHASEILPDFQKNLDEASSIIFLPLHFQDKAIGYVAFKYNFYHVNFYSLYIWSMNISANLENLRIKQEISHLAHHYKELYVKDSLTGLNNRRGFYNLADPAFAKAKEQSLPITIISIDLDELKPINDIYGHYNGDIALKAIAKTIKCLSDCNFVASRFGGDEFVIFISNFDKKKAKDFISGFNNRLRDFNKKSNLSYEINASTGFYSKTPNFDDTIDEFIKHADKQMYAQKALKRNKKYRNDSR